MWTIGYINDIKDDAIYVTYSHVDKNIEFRTLEKFALYEIVSIHLEHKWNNYGGVEWEDDEWEDGEIVDIAHFDENIRTEFVYSYQETLLNIIRDDYINGDFAQRLKNKFSRFLIDDFLDLIIRDDIDQLTHYVNSISIEELVKHRKIRIIETKDKYGEYTGCKVECTDYRDTYLNGLLHIYGSYSPWCVNNTPERLPRETYNQTVERVAKTTAFLAIKNYSKMRHLQILLDECLQIKEEYKTKKENIHKIANEYMNYPLNK